MLVKSPSVNLSFERKQHTCLQLQMLEYSVTVKSNVVCYCTSCAPQVLFLSVTGLVGEQYCVKDFDLHVNFVTNEGVGGEFRNKLEYVPTEV